jgi:hypothetical protein
MRGIVPGELSIVINTSPPMVVNKKPPRYVRVSVSSSTGSMGMVMSLAK